MPLFGSYFSTTAQISGGLLGLTFVVLTFNPNKLGMRHDVRMRSLAEQVFSDFLTVMIASLILIIPHFRAEDAGLMVAMLGVLGLVRIARSALILFRGMQAFRSKLLQRFVMSLLGNIGLLAAGIMLDQGTDASAAWSAMVFAPILLLVAGSRSAWLLVTQNTD